MPTRKLWDHDIEIKEGFMIRKGKIYMLLRREGEEVCKFISEQLRKCVMNLFLRVGNKNNSCIRETQENSMEFQVQSSLPYILIPMIHANYCASYPK